MRPWGIHPCLASLPACPGESTSATLDLLACRLPVSGWVLSAPFFDLKLSLCLIALEHAPTCRRTFHTMGEPNSLVRSFVPRRQAL